MPNFLYTYRAPEDVLPATVDAIAAWHSRLAKRPAYVIEIGEIMMLSPKQTLIPADVYLLANSIELGT